MSNDDQERLEKNPENGERLERSAKPGSREKERVERGLGADQERME